MTALSHILGDIVCILASGCGSGWQRHRFSLWILWAPSSDRIRYKFNHLNRVGENRNCWAQLLRKGGAAYQGATFSVTSTVTPLSAVNSIEICDGVRGEVQLWIPPLPASLQFSCRLWPQHPSRRWFFGSVSNPQSIFPLHPFPRTNLSDGVWHRHIPKAFESKAEADGHVQSRSRFAKIRMFCLLLAWD